MRNERLGRLRFGVLLALLGLTGCGGDDQTQGLFSGEQACSVAAEFHRAWMARDLAAIARTCGEPFTFRKRPWTKRSELLANLESQVQDPRIAAQAGATPEIRAYSRRELLEGRDVTGLDLPKDRTARALALDGVGIEGPDAFLVRVSALNRAGWLLVVAAGAESRLEVRSFLP